MKKKVSIIVTATALVALIIVGSTLAFFTSQGTVSNVITMGDVKISLTEPDFKDSGVVPGQTITKDPTVNNIGSHDAYIRCKINLVVPTGDNEDITLDRKNQLLSGIAFGDESGTVKAKDWVLAKDGYYYYQKKLPVEQSVVFFNSVTVPAKWDNDFADKHFEINVTADAIQTDNFTPNITDNVIDGWNYSTVSGVVGSAVEVQSSPTSK